jgi:hypothetical protein
MSAPDGSPITGTRPGARDAASAIADRAGRGRAEGRGSVASGPVYREDAHGRAVPADRLSSCASTGRLERSLRRAVAARPADGLAHVGLFVGPDVPDRLAPSLTAAVNALVSLAARDAGARRVDIVVGRRGDELVAQAQYDGRCPGADPAVDAHAARLAGITRRVEDLGGTVDVRRTGGRTVTRLRIGVAPRPRD